MNKNSRRHKEHAKRRGGGGYVALPHAVIRSQEWAELSPFAVKLMMDMLSQYKGDNNGDLAMYWSKMHRERGWKSKETLFKSLAELRNAGWLELTRIGMRNKTPALYAVTFYAIDYCGGKLEVSPTGSPSGAWRRPEAVKPIVPRSESPAPAVTTAADPARPARAVPVTYRKAAFSRVRQVDLKEENRSGSRTCDQGEQPNRYASRTYSGDSAPASGTPAVPLSRITTTTGAEQEREKREGPGASAGAIESGASYAGDLVVRRDELLDYARALMRAHGNSDRLIASFLGQMKRPDKFGENFLLVAIAEYLERHPQNSAGKPFDARWWIFYRVRELIGKPFKSDGQLIRIP